MQQPQGGSKPLAMVHIPAKKSRKKFMSPLILWGSINADGTIASGSGGFSVTAQGSSGQYVISFRTLFQGVPAVVGSQNRFGGLNESSLDNVVFPLVDSGTATALTGDSDNHQQPRNFAFIAIGNPGGLNPKHKE
jgi:hypothetical protein